MTVKKKIVGAAKSKTYYAGAALGLMVAVQPQLMDTLKYRLDDSDYALAGLIITGVVWVLRWVTDGGLQEK